MLQCWRFETPYIESGNLIVVMGRLSKEKKLGNDTGLDVVDLLVGFGPLATNFSCLVTILALLLYLNFGKFKMALNATYRIFFNFAKSCA